MSNQIRGKRLPLFIIYIFITSVSIGALLITVWFTRTSYSSLVDSITQTLKRPDLKPLITRSLFTEQKYGIVHKYHWIFYPVIIITSIVLYRKSNLIYKTLFFSIRHLKVSFFHLVLFFNGLKKKEKLLLWLICGLYIGVVLYNNHLKEISYDEAWGYNYYINKPFYFPIILFNTYPLYNLTAHILTFLPFDTLITIRLPSLIFGLLTLLVLFYILYAYFGFVLAYFGLIILTASPLFYIYSTLSRGITLSLFLSSLVLYTTLSIYNNREPKVRYYFLYIVFNSLGIFSMPTFIVFTVATSLFLIICRYKQKGLLKSILSKTSIILLISAIFYLPVLLTSGSELIYHNNHYVFTISETAKKLGSLLLGLSQLFFISKYLVIMLLFISLVLLFSESEITGKRSMILFSLFVIGFTLLARAATGNIFPERSLNFLIICFIIILLCIAAIFVHRLDARIKVILALAVFFLAPFFYKHNQEELFSPAEDRDAKIIGELLIKNKVKTAYIDEEEFWLRVPMIQYYYSRQHKEISFKTSAINSTRYQRFDINKNYDCIVCKPSFSSNIDSSYKEIYRNGNFLLLKRL